MGRHPKEGVDYFPLDVQVNDKVKLIQAEFGLVGFAILIRLWQKIYGGKGYYTDWDEDVALVFADDCRVGASVVSEVVSACLRRGLFDRQIYDQYKVLTSEGSQERYAEATERRTSQEIDGRYLLIAMPENWVDVNKNAIYVNINAENDDMNPQSKVKYSKVNKTITTTTDSARAKPSDLDIIAYFTERIGEDRAGKEAFKWARYNDNRGWDCLPDWRSAADAWVRNIDY